MKHPLLLFALLSGLLNAHAQTDSSDWDKYMPEPFNPADGTWKSLIRCDDCYEIVQLPFSFFFFDKPYSSIFISTNGVVSFTAGVWSYSPDPFPISGQPPMIAPYWSDVDTRTVKDTYNNKVWYKVYSDKLVVIWDSVSRFTGSYLTDSLNKFELTLYDNSKPLHVPGKFVDARFTYDTLSWVRGFANTSIDFPIAGWQDGYGNNYNLPGSASGRLQGYPGPFSKAYQFYNPREAQTPPPLPAAPAISYPDSIYYTAGTAITPVTITNTGGTVPATRYGSVTTFAGSSRGYTDSVTALNARFNRPFALATDRPGNVYVGDAGNFRTRKIDVTGNVSTTLYSTTTEQYSMGFATDLTGYLYKAYSNAKAVGRFTYASLPNYVYSVPAGIAVDTTGNVYIADISANRIWFSTASGNATTVTMGYMNPVYAGSGTPGMTNGAAATAQFNQPAGVARDTSGNLYVADMGNNQIRKITPAGIVSLFAGSPTGAPGNTNGTGPDARFNKPAAIATDRLGNIYVSDFANYVIRKITPGGVVTTIAGSGVAGLIDTTLGSAARFKNPGGIAIDQNGNVLVADTGNHRIRKIITTGYTISPALPTGFRFDSTTGTVSGTSATLLTPTTYTVIAYNMGGNDTATFVLAPSPVALAIKLGGINATNKGSVNEVHWNSISEETGDVYQVERSTNANNFTSIGNVPGKAIYGSSYTYIDQWPVTGINYYRLKFLNADGSSGYSKIVTATKKEAFGISVFPNPAKSEVTIKLNEATNGIATVTLYDFSGKQFSSTRMSGKQVTVSLTGLPAGTYLVRYQDKQYNELFSIIKK